MFKTYYYTLAILSMAFSSQAIAQCSTGQITNSTTPSLAETLIGNTVCVGSSPTFEHQEIHYGTGAAGSSLWDYKRGSGHAIDPTVPIGTWEVSGNNASHIITYTYTGGVTTYPYKVYDNA